MKSLFDTIRQMLGRSLSQAEVDALNAALTPDDFTPPAPFPTLSDAGLRFLYDREAQRGVSNRPHWPGGGSGVTLGPGYDLKDRTAADVIATLTRLGIEQPAARQMAGGARLQGAAARDFARRNRDVLALSPHQERRLLEGVVVPYEKTVAASLRVPVTQAQFDALVSLAYNIGETRFLASSVLRLLNSGDYTRAQAGFAAWNKSGGRVVPGLDKRRAMEMAMFAGAQMNRVGVAA